MPDALGWRAKFGVLGPSTNTIVQPDFDDLRVPGVTNHYSRIVIEDAQAISDETFMAGTLEINENVLDAVRAVMTCAPDYLVMGMSAVTFYGGAEGARSRRKRAWFALIGALCVLAAVEGACRVYWWTRGVPLLKSPARMHAPLYPRLAWVEQQWVGEDDLYDVLILGGSVVSDGFGSVGAQLAEELTARHGVRVRVHNVGARAHTSRDSLLKYRRLWRQKFDLVVVYHGINEVRANNCPPDLFREDYSHYSFYRNVDRLLSSRLVSWSRLH